MISKICIICGKEYFPANNRQKTCGKECAQKLESLSAKCRYKSKISTRSKKSKICFFCGKEFIAEHGNVTFCSENCKLFRRRERDRKRKSLTPKNILPMPIQCAYCAIIFIPLLNRPNQKYCSRSCRDRAHHKKECGPNGTRNIRKWENKAKTICRKCGNLFIATKHYQKYCSDKCKPQERHCGIIQCPICGRDFKQNNINQKICNDENCVKQHASNLAKNLNKKRAILRRFICIECGCQVTTSYGDKHKRYCSDDCAIARQSRIEKRKRRARKLNNGKVESIDPIVIFTRDGWKCRLCGKKTPKKLRGTINDNAPELDHVIPLSKGGPHTFANVQTACRKCNQLKGATIGGQPGFELDIPPLKVQKVGVVERRGPQILLCTGSGV